MRIKLNRDILKFSRMARADIGRRWILYIAAPAISPDVAADPFAPGNEPNPDTDTVIIGAGVFQQTKDAVQGEVTGDVITRKATLQVHPTYEPYFQRGYAVKVGQETGLFEILGVTTDTTRLVCTISLMARQ